MNPKQYDVGDKVLTPCGIGTVQYKRMKPPYSEVYAYSVALDAIPNHRGTIVFAEDVKEVPKY